MLDAKSSALVKGLIKEYYSSIGEIAPREISKREFGFGDFERKITYRHLTFKDWKALRSYLVMNAPPFVSISSAYYQHPDGRPMESKGWIGAELVFDLDANDLNLPCKAQHGGAWVCDICLGAVKAETIKLVEDFLIPDFGFGEREISVNFSGNRGYHIHVDKDAIRTLDSRARESISNYITGKDMELSAFLPALGAKGAKLEGPRPTEYGWGGKLARGAIAALNSGPDELMKLGIDKRTANMLTKNRAEIILGITTGNYDKVRIPKKDEFWKSILNRITVRQSDSIDRNVSIDTHHLLRLPDTIHGDTALVSRSIKSLSELSAFDPLADSIAFGKGTLTIKTDKVPSFSIGGKTYGPYEDKRVELETPAALYVVLKRHGTVV